jgi:GDP-4-dehydro-6-deoxy-D-mannose reductase
LKALITGILGFAGRHLTEYLQGRGDEVAGIDNGDPDEIATFSKSHNNIKIYVGDLRDEHMLTKAIKQFGPDTIVHLAAQSSVRMSFENPLETFSVNIIGTLVLFETISKMEFPIKTLAITSSEVYGRLTPEECPVTEEHPLKPVNPYAVSKATVDLMAYQYWKAFGMPIYMVRAFSHSGPYQKTVAVLSDWAMQVAKIDLGISQPVIKVGNLDVVRDYSDVRDVVRAYVALVEKGKPGEPYNVCSGIGYQLSDLLAQIKGFSSKKIDVIIDQSRMRPVDIPLLVGSNEKIRRDTGWNVTIPIDRTLRDTFNFWREYLVEEV